MSRRVAAWVVALGCIALAVGIWRHHRVAEVPRPVEAPNGESEASTRPVEQGAEIDDVVSSAQQQPKLLDERSIEERFPIPPESTELPVSKIADEKSEASRRFFWSYLRTFAAKADLTESEWQRFLGDISDVASTAITADDTAMEELPGATPKQVRTSLEDASRLTDELALELDERCASWMTEKQLKAYRFRINALGVISQMRNLKTFAYTSAILSDARR